MNHDIDQRLILGMREIRANLAVGETLHSRDAVEGAILLRVLEDGPFDEDERVALAARLATHVDDDPKFSKYDLADAVTHSPLAVSAGKLLDMADDAFEDATRRLAAFKRASYAGETPTPPDVDVYED